MIRREEGFSLVELLITMVIFVLTLAAASSLFVPLLTQFKQQSKTSETQMESLIGLELLRRDIEHAGFGLPWAVPASVAYTEAANAPENGFNDTPSGVPRAILSADNTNFGVSSDVIKNTDYLVIKATSVAASAAAAKWTTVVGMPGGGSKVKLWGDPVEDFQPSYPSDKTIVLIPSRGQSESSQRILVTNGSSYTVAFNGTTFPSAFSPATLNDVYLIYGIDDKDSSYATLRMPFNRADYYVSKTNVPQRCAPNTGVLKKNTVSQKVGTFAGGVLPLLDCVADMQIVFGLDKDNDGNFTPGVSPKDGYNSDLSGLSAQQIRDQLKEVRVYILAHEGQKDASYTHASNTIQMPAPPDPAAAVGRTFDFGASGITNWQNYHWKVYTLVVKPKNLR